MMSKLVYAIEGLDRLGKSTLIDGLVDKLGYYQIIHFGKPKKLSAYTNSYHVDYPEYTKIKNPDLYFYQKESFLNSMIMANSGARIIFDRWHLGEAVYANMYRGYNGDYVFDLEKSFKLDESVNLRLILLVEDFNKANHFVDDGDSLGPIEKRFQEQEKFLSAFDRSIIKDKKIVCVTDTNTGKFRSKEEILQEVI